MKFLILNLILLPSVVFGINTIPTSTNNWEQDESFTLSTPSKEDGENTPINMHHGPVEVSLSGPFDKSTVSTSLTDNGSSTTVDPIMSLILKTLLEDRFNNELNPEASINKTRNNNNSPLTYMTPPSIPVNKEIVSTKSSSSEEFDEATSTTTMSNDETSTTTDSSENDESIESSTPAIIMAQNFDTKMIPSSHFTYDSQQKEQNEGEYLVSSTTGKPIEQYAERYQDYFPQVKSEKSTAFDNVPSEEAPYENEESVTAKNNIRPLQNTNQMDQVTFDNPRTQTDQEQEVTPNQPQSDNDKSTNNYEPRPIYYFFLRPRVFPNQRDAQSPLMMSPMSQPYSEATDPWHQYPERRLSLARLPFIAQDYDSQQVATQASLNMPYRNPYNNNNYYNSYPSDSQYNYNQQFLQTQFMPRPYFPQMQTYFQPPMMAMSPYSSRPYYSPNNYNNFRTNPYYNYNAQYSNIAYPQRSFIGMTN